MQAGDGGWSVGGQRTKRVDGGAHHGIAGFVQQFAYSIRAMPGGIGPGVVPFGVDPAYDAQYKLNQAPRSHVASHGQGKPFTVEPGPHQRTQ